MNDETNELMDYLGRISKKSIDGKIEWAQPNPSTFKWLEKKNEVEFQVSIQKVSSPKIGIRGTRASGSSVFETEFFVFQVRSSRDRSVALSLSSKERPEFQQVMAAIFKGAERGMDVRASNILKSLLGE